jgi:hypothetical protein
MAIIKGMKTADVGEITPYNEDIDKLASGILAREGRAEETRNAIADARNQMLLKETRDNTEDMELAQKLERGFASDVDAMLDKADADYSMISKGDLQRLAGDYMGKTEWRALTNAKIQTDIYNDSVRKIKAEGGDPVIFGKNPNEVSLFDEEGNINHLTDTFEVEKRLDHSKAAKELFDGIGKKIMIKAGYDDKAEGHTHDKWLLRYRTWIDEDESNVDQVNSIIDGSLDTFITDPEGRQYYRIHYEDQKDLGKSNEEADTFAKEKVKSLIRTYGESEYIIKDTDKEDFRLQTVPTPKTVGGGKTSPSSEEEWKPERNSAVPKTVSYKGITLPNEDAVGYYNSLNAEPTASQIAEAVNGKEDVNNMTNNNMLIGSALMVFNPNDPNNKGAGQTGQLAGDGYLMKLEQQVKTKNKSSVLSINTNYEAISEIKDLERQLQTAKDAKKPDTEIKEIENKLLNKKLNNVSLNNYKDLYNNGQIKTTQGDISNIVKEVGDNLFQRDDIMNMLDDDPKFEERSSEMDKNVFNSLRTDYNDNGWKSGAISTFSTNENENNLDIVISPFLDQMKNYYAKQLIDFINPTQITAVGDPILDENGNVVYDENHLGEVTLLKAKIQHINNKIDKAKKFLIDNEPAVDKLKSKYTINYYKQRNLYDRLTILARKNDFTDAEINAGVHLGLSQKLDERGGLVTIQKKINTEAEKKAGLNFNDADAEIEHYRGRIYKAKYGAKRWENASGKIERAWISEKGDKKDINYALDHLKKAEDAHNKFRINILENKYTLEDIKNTEWYKNNKKEIEENGLNNYLLDAAGGTSGNKARYMGLYTSLLEKEFETKGLRDKDPTTGRLDKKYGRAVNYTIDALLGIRTGNDRGPIQTQWGTFNPYGALAPPKIIFNDEQNKLMIDLELSNGIDKAKKKAMKKVYSGEAHVLEYLKDVDNLQSQMDRKSLLFTTSSDIGAKNLKYWENLKNDVTIEFDDINTELRKVIYSDEKGDGEFKEKGIGYKQYIKSLLNNAWDQYVDNGGKEEEGDFKKEWVKKSFLGIRLDYTNEGPMFVAHYRDAATGKEWEHNTVLVNMSQAMEKFGIEGARIKYTQLFKNSLENNSGFFADLPNFNNKKPIRFHLATDNKGVDINGNQIKKGQYFMMQKRPSDRTTDDYPGKINYPLSDISQYDIVAFPTMDKIFNHIRKTNEKAMNRVEILQKHIAKLKSSSSIIPSNYFPEDNSLSKLSSAEAIKELEKMINITIEGKSASVDNTPAATNTNTANQLPENFQLPGS